MSRIGKRSSRSCDAPRRSGARGFVAAAGRHGRRALFIALAALTAGCGAQRSVTVFHLFREPGVPDERYAALRNVEIDFPAPASSAAAQMGEALLRALGSRSGVPSGYAVDNVAFGFVLSRALEANGAGVAGFRTVLGGDFHPDLDATGFLTVHPVRVTFGRSERVAEEIHTDKKGRRAKVAVRMADFSALAALDVALTDKAGRPLFAEVIQSRAQTQETRADAATGDAFFSALQERAVEPPIASVPFASRRITGRFFA